MRAGSCIKARCQCCPMSWHTYNCIKWSREREAIQEAIHYEARILRLLPVLQVSQVLEERWVLQKAVLRKPWKNSAFSKPVTTMRPRTSRTFRC